MFGYIYLLLLHLFSVANLLMPNARNVPDSLIFKTCYGNLKRSVRQPDLLSCKTLRFCYELNSDFMELTFERLFGRIFKTKQSTYILFLILFTTIEFKVFVICKVCVYQEVKIQIQSSIQFSMNDKSQKRFLDMLFYMYILD